MTTYPHFGYSYTPSSQLLGSPASGTAPGCCPVWSYAPNSSLYPSLGRDYALKDDNNATLAGLAQSSYYSYDAAALGYPYSASYPGMDLSHMRRKTPTRETTNMLKAWLNEHKKNPYPTKGEKIMLAIITKMTLTQVSTWFANARRRLKKENKVTWEPRNKVDDGDDDPDGDVDKDDDDDKLDDDRKDQKDIRESDDHISFHASDALGVNDDLLPSVTRNINISLSDSMGNVSQQLTITRRTSNPKIAIPQTNTRDSTDSIHIDVTSSDSRLGHPIPSSGPSSSAEDKMDLPSDSSQVKPRIWSLAQTATESGSPTHHHHPSPLSAAHPPNVSQFVSMDKEDKNNFRLSHYDNPGLAAPFSSFQSWLQGSGMYPGVLGNLGTPPPGYSPLWGPLGMRTAPVTTVSASQGVIPSSEIKSPNLSTVLTQSQSAVDATQGCSTPELEERQPRVNNVLTSPSSTRGHMDNILRSNHKTGALGQSDLVGRDLNRQGGEPYHLPTTNGLRIQAVPPLMLNSLFGKDVHSEDHVTAFKPIIRR